MKKYIGAGLFTLCTIALPGLVYGSTASLSRADIVRYTGEAESDFAGISVSEAGDVNGDGYDDMIIGADDNDAGGLDAGAAYLIYGSASGITSQSFSTAVKFTGETADDSAGVSVSGAGDMNGDGYDDMIVGAYGNDTGGSNAGAAYVVYGKADKYTGSASLSTAANFTGQAGGDSAGYSVSGAGDMNGDGYDDVIVGAHGNSSNRGAAYVIYGKAEKYTGSASLSSAAKFTGEAESDYAGYSVSGAGDVNGDGYDDIVVGADDNDSGGSNAGAAYVVYGKAEKYIGSVSLSSVARFTGEAASDSAGGSVSGAGDVNSDGYADMIVGADENDGGGSNAGAAYVVYGKADKYTGFDSLSNAAKFTGQAGGDEAGYSVSGAGDVNGDGYDDMIVGAYGNDTGGSNAGAAYVVYGKADKYTGSDSLSNAAKFTGQAVDDSAGYSVSGGGDVNGDGYNDMLIGAYGNSSSTGAVYVVMPKPSQLQLVTANTDENNVLSCDEEYEEKGATAVDPVTNSALAVTVSGDVLDTPGTYKKTYTVTSNSWNIVTTAERSVVVPDCTPMFETNGKYLQVIVNDEIVDKKKIGKKKIAKKYYKVVEKKLYTKKPYTTVAVLRSGKKKASVIVFRLTEKNQLKKKVKKSVELVGKRTPLKLKLNTKKKRVSISIGKGTKKVEALYKVTKKGELKEIE